MKKSVLILVMFLIFINGYASQKVRIKEVARVQGVRSNQLIGMGIVIGLQGSGDKSSLAPQMLNNLFSYFGTDIARDQINSQNIAVVMVTAELAPFKKEGDSIDVTVSSVNDAKSIEGGVLLQTPLKAADGGVYAVAQGSLTKVANRTTNRVNGVIPNGAIVEKEVPVDMEEKNKVVLVLTNADFTTASRIAEAINERFSYDSAKAIDATRVEVKKAYTFSEDIVSFISSIENLEVETDRKSVIVINEKTGTVILGDNISVASVAIAHGNLSVNINAQNDMDKAYTTDGALAISGNAKSKNTAKSFYFKGSTVKDVVKMLNAVGATPDDIISIIQALKTAGAIDAEIKTM